MPPSGSGGQHMPGSGEQGMGDGAPQGGLCRPQQGVPMGLQQHPGPHPQHPPAARPPHAPPFGAPVAAQRILLLFTPIIMLA